MALDVSTPPDTPSSARLFPGTFTLPEVNVLLEPAPQSTLQDPTHIGFGFHSDVNVTAPRFQGGCLGRGVAALSRQRQHSDINMRRSDWRDGELLQLLTIMGEKEMQSH